MMAKKLEPFEEDVVNKVKSGSLDGKKYEYVMGRHTKNSSEHKVEIEDGVIKETITTYGKFFNGKENERFSQITEKVYKTPRQILNKIQSDHFRYKNDLDLSGFDAQRAEKAAPKATEQAERLESIGEPSENDDFYEPSTSKEPDSTNEFGLGELVAVAGLGLAAYLINKIVKK